MSPVPFLRFFTISVQCATYNYPNDSVFHPLRVQWELLPTERYADRSRHPRANRVTKRNTKASDIRALITRTLDYVIRIVV